MVSGYMNSFQAWSYAKDAFDKWSLLVATRFAELRGVTPARLALDRVVTMWSCALGAGSRGVRGQHEIRSVFFGY